MTPTIEAILQQRGLQAGVLIERNEIEIAEVSE